MQMETIAACRIAYVRKMGTYGPDNGEAMETLKRWAAKEGRMTEEAVFLGIPQDDPRTTAPEACRYDACLIIGDEEALAENEVTIGTWGGGRYAVFQLEHTAEAMEHAWASIPARLAAEGYAINDRPIIERYRGRLLLADRCELCIPVRELQD